MEQYKRVLDREYTPTSEEFNHLMGECIEYKKLLELKKALEWFGDTLPYVSSLHKIIDKRIEEIPEVARIFDTLPHGQTTKK